MLDEYIRREMEDIFWHMCNRVDGMLLGPNDTIMMVGSVIIILRGEKQYEITATESERYQQLGG